MAGQRFFAALTAILLHVSFCSATRHLLTVPQTTDFIKRSCSSTTYPRLCYSSLSVHASAIQTSPKLLASTALNVSLASAKSTSNLMVKFSHGRGMTPREVSAMKDCVEELADSVYEIRKSIDEMAGDKHTDLQFMISNVQTWVSAALTDESTCTDGFDDETMNGHLKTAVSREITHIAQLTSNALALVNQYATVIESPATHT